MITDLFMCPRGEQRETYDALLARPHDDPEREKHGLLLLKTLDIVVLGQLAEALGAADGVLDPDLDDLDEAILCEFGPGFVEALAAAAKDEARLRRAANVWIAAWTEDLATIKAFKGKVPESMRPRLEGDGGWLPVLQDVVHLAARAQARGWSVYLLMAP